MDKLKRIIDNLTAQEIRQVHQFYLADSNQRIQKRYELFRLVAEEGVSDNHQACRILYLEDSSSSFCHLKKRLQEDLLDILLLSSQSSDSRILQREVECHKLYLKAKILISRGVIQEGIALMERVSQLAEKDELLDLKIASDQSLLQLSNENEGDSSRLTYEDMSSQMRMFALVSEARLSDHYYCIGDGRSMSAVTEVDRNLTDWTDQRVESSGIMEFWKKKALLNLYHHRNDEEMVRCYATQLASMFFQKSRLASSPEELAAGLHVTKVLLEGQEYNEALKLGQLLSRNLKVSPVAYLQSLELIFLAHFRLNRLDEARKVIHEATDFVSRIGGDPKKWPLLEATLNFAEQKFKSVNRLLYSQKLTDIGSEWKIAYKYLELLNILETGEYDWFEYKLDAFRKRLTDLIQNRFPRLRLIYLVFRHLIRQNYDYPMVISQQGECIEQLRHGQGSCHWDPAGFELINFPHWILSKNNLIAGSAR